MFRPRKFLLARLKRALSWNRFVASMFDRARLDQWGPDAEPTLLRPVHSR